MTSQSVAAQEDDVGRQDQRAQPDTESGLARSQVRKPHGFPNVARQHDQKEKRNIQKITVNIKQDQREMAFSQVVFARLPYRARRRVRPERLVIGTAVVVARQAKQAGKWKDQQGRRKGQPRRPPRRHRPKPRMRGFAENFGRVERRKIRSPIIVLSLESSPRRVNDKGRKTHKDQQRREPPSITAHGLAKLALLPGHLGKGHKRNPLLPGRLWPDTNDIGSPRVISTFDATACWCDVKPQTAPV